MIEEALTTCLLAHVGLTALIGTRFGWDIAPQDTALPYVVGMKVSDVKDHHYGGQDTLESPSFQFSVYATTKAGARAVTNQLKAALCDYTGTLSGIVIQQIRLLNEMSGAETSGDGTQKIYVEDLEFEVHFVRS